MMLATNGRIIFGAAVGILVVEGENFYQKKKKVGGEKRKTGPLE